jgi:hypothetical protein
MVDRRLRHPILCKKKAHLANRCSTTFRVLSLHLMAVIGVLSASGLTNHASNSRLHVSGHFDLAKLRTSVRIVSSHQLLIWLQVADLRISPTGDSESLGAHQNASNLSISEGLPNGFVISRVLRQVVQQAYVT